LIKISITESLPPAASTLAHELLLPQRPHQPVLWPKRRTLETRAGDQIPFGLDNSPPLICGTALQHSHLPGRNMLFIYAVHCWAAGLLGLPSDGLTMALEGKEFL